MPRRRRDYLEATHGQVVSWASWVLRYVVSSGIGYPRQTVESRMAEAAGAGRMPAHSIVPDLMMPQTVAQVDRALAGMPPDLLMTVSRKYLVGKRVSNHKSTQALIWICARIDAKK